MPEPTWNGFLRLSLVSCPVYLSAAITEGRRVRLDRLSARTGNPVSRQFVDSKTGDVVEHDSVVRGYQFDGSRYVSLSSDELRALESEPSRIIDIDNFVPADEIDRLYIETIYYLYPDGQLASDTVHALRMAMTRSGRVGLGRVQIRERERIALIEPRGAGLLLSTLRSADDVAPTEFTERAEHEIPSEMIEIAESIIGRRVGSFNASHLRDSHEDALRALVEDKVRNAPEAEPEPEPEPAPAPPPPSFGAGTHDAAPPQAAPEPLFGAPSYPQTHSEPPPDAESAVGEPEAHPSPFSMPHDAAAEAHPSSLDSDAPGPLTSAFPAEDSAAVSPAAGFAFGAAAELGSEQDHRHEHEQGAVVHDHEHEHDRAEVHSHEHEHEAGHEDDHLHPHEHEAGHEHGEAHEHGAEHEHEAGPSAAADPQELGTEILLHIVGLGDRRYIEPGWAGNPGSRRQIEALSIRPHEGLPSSAVEFKVFAQEGRATSWVSDGNYAGTRGRGLPLTGFAVRPAADEMARLEIVYEGCFFEGGVVGPKRDGEVCVSPVANDPLEAVRVTILERGR